MKKTYISPELLIVELATRNHLMEISIVSDRNATVSGNNMGLVKEENNTVTDKSVWDNEW